MKFTQIPSTKHQLSQSQQERLKILEMPILDLAQYIQSEIQENPFLKEPKHKKISYIPDQLPYQKTLHEKLLQQIQEVFMDKEQRDVAIQLIGYLDDRGFFTQSEEMISLELLISKANLNTIIENLQTLDPPGIFAFDLRQSWLLQLKRLNETKTVSYQIIENDYELLKDLKFNKLKTKYREADLKNCLKRLKTLCSSPLSSLGEKIPASTITPDLIITRNELSLEVCINCDEIPDIEIQEGYLTIKTADPEQKMQLCLWKDRAKRLIANVKNRNSMLISMAKILIKKQNDYLDNLSAINNFTPKELAELMQVHESTVYRMVANKYASTPSGVIPLKSLFSAKGRSTNVQNELLRMILNQTNSKELTDKELTEKLIKQGVKIARRTVAKYRKNLHILSSKSRFQIRNIDHLPT